MVHAAVGFAKQANRLRAFACLSSIGPGATNMVTGAASATINHVPVLLLAGDMFAERVQAPVLQQLEVESSQAVSVNDTFRPVVRYWDRIERPEQVITALPEVMRVLTSPADTGAVLLALPQDIQTYAFDFPVEMFEKRTWSIPRNRPDAAAPRGRGPPDPGEPPTGRSSRAAACATATRWTPCARSPSRRASRWPRPTPARARCRTTTP